MVYLLVPHASASQMNTTKFKQDFIGPLFIDMVLDKTHYRLKDTTGLLLDGTYHVNHIKKGSARTPLGIVDKFDTYVVRRSGRLAPRQPLSVCTLLPTYERNRHLRPPGNLGHCMRRPRWID